MGTDRREAKKRCANRGRRPEFEKMIDFIKSQKKKPQS